MVVARETLEAFMGRSVVEPSPLASLQEDIETILWKGFTNDHLKHVMNPFEASHFIKSVASKLIGDASVLFDDVAGWCSSSMSDKDSKVEGSLSEYIIKTMLELLNTYDLQTCMVLIRENFGERIFVIHRDACNTLWSTEKFLSLSKLSRLLVVRKIPTIVEDMSKDDRFVDKFASNSTAARMRAQIPIGFDLKSRNYMGSIDLIGRQAFNGARLSDFALLVQKADDIETMLRKGLRFEPPTKVAHRVAPGLINGTSPSTFSGGALPVIEDSSDCESDSDADVENEVKAGAPLSEHIFKIMLELVNAYHLQTCFVTMRENGGERLFVIHCGMFNLGLHTQKFMSSAKLSSLLVMRSIPTIIQDMSKNHGFVHRYYPDVTGARFRAQVPIGFDDRTGDYIGIIDMVGRQALNGSPLRDFDLLVEKAEEISHCIQRQQACTVA